MRALASLFILAVAFSVIAPTAFSQDAAGVRVTHLSPDTAPVDIWVDGTLMREYLSYQHTTQYLNLSEGEHQIEIRPYGEANTLTALSVSLLAGVRYSVGIIGLSGLSDLALVSLVDDQESLLFFSKVRFVHASPGVPAVDIAIAGGPVLVSNLDYRQSSGYVEVRPDVYDLQVRIAGTSTVLFTIPHAGLSRGANCTIYTTGEGEEAGMLETVSTFDVNIHLDYQQVILGLTIWAALLAWFVQNHAPR